MYFEFDNMPQYFLTQSIQIRISAFTLFYVAQGVPIGLMSIAMPAWLASQDFDAARIAAFVSITGLPWAFKLVAGPFMDRFSFLPMGFRRPWVMAAQGGLTLAVLSMSTVSDPAGQFWLMVSIGFAINCFSAIQDVAVDGMAIDVLPDHERGRVNAFMAFGQVIGFSVFGALCGWLLVMFGLALTALVCAIAVAAVFLMAVLVRERQGERMLPWSVGKPSERLVTPPESVRSVFTDLIRVFFLPMGLILIAAEFISRMGAGVTLTVAPLVAVQEIGYAAEDYASWYGLMGGASALLGLAFGPLVDRYGAKPILMLGFGLAVATSLLFAAARPLWDVPAFVIPLFFIKSLQYYAFSAC